MVQQSTLHPEPEWSGSVQHAHSLPDHPGSLLKTIQGNRGGPLPFDAVPRVYIAQFLLVTNIVVPIVYIVCICVINGAVMEIRRLMNI